ncbi:MAG TPA: formate dehydrogenase accessory sulfurtransferase FdhD [Candidatus Binataceae bacterium]|jgi:FdhD protein|nr:formate dehydrogenase accessory sulfurtransferase FdhD [Candidatus Binataceae bacterium]
MPDDANRIAESAERAAASESIRHHPARKFRDGRFAIEEDRLAVEEPLEIRLGGRRFTLTMRTPGNDEELVAGFLLAEGFIESRTDLGEIRRLRGPKGAPDPNAVDVVLNVPAANLRERLKRNFTISSSCGVCGKTSIEATQRRIAPIVSRMTVAASAILELAPMMRHAQEVFAATGGLHAAALFVPSTGSMRSNGPRKNGARKNGHPATALTSVELKALREDVGRHNAVDKVVGYALMNGMLPLGTALMAVSGRLSFEIVQKAAAAGVPILVAVSAPSSLAVELAEEVGITLVGFLRNGTFNLYCHPDRIVA